LLGKLIDLAIIANAIDLFLLPPSSHTCGGQFWSSLPSNHSQFRTAAAESQVVRGDERAGAAD
jgi:hypothetical protein